MSARIWMVLVLATAACGVDGVVDLQASDPRLGALVYETEGFNAYPGGEGPVGMQYTLTYLAVDSAGVSHVLLVEKSSRKWGEHGTIPGKVVYRTLSSDGVVIDRVPPSLGWPLPGKVYMDFAADGSAYVVEVGGRSLGMLARVHVRQGQGWKTHQFLPGDRPKGTTLTKVWAGDVRVVDAEHVVIRHDDAMVVSDGDGWRPVAKPADAKSIRFAAWNKDRLRLLWIDADKTLWADELETKTLAPTGTASPTERKGWSFEMFAWSGTVDTFVIELPVNSETTTLRFSDELWRKVDDPYRQGRLINCEHPDRGLRTSGGQYFPVWKGKTSTEVVATFQSLLAVPCPVSCAVDSPTDKVSRECEICTWVGDMQAAFAWPLASMEGMSTLMITRVGKRVEVYVKKIGFPFPQTPAVAPYEPGPFPGEVAEDPAERRIVGKVVVPGADTPAGVTVTLEQNGTVVSQLVTGDLGLVDFAGSIPDGALQVVARLFQHIDVVVDIEASDVGLVDIGSLRMVRDFAEPIEGIERNGWQTRLVDKHLIVQWRNHELRVTDLQTGQSALVANGLTLPDDGSEPFLVVPPRHLVFSNTSGGTTTLFVTDGASGSSNSLITGVSLNDARARGTQGVVYPQTPLDGTEKLWNGWSPIASQIDAFSANDVRFTPDCKLVWVEKPDSGSGVFTVSNCSLSGWVKLLPLDAKPAGARVTSRPNHIYAWEGTDCGSLGRYANTCKLWRPTNGAWELASEAAYGTGTTASDMYLNWFEAQTGGKAKLVAAGSNQTIEYATGVRLAPEYWPGETLIRNPLYALEWRSANGEMRWNGGYLTTLDARSVGTWTTPGNIKVVYRAPEGKTDCASGCAVVVNDVVLIDSNATGREFVDNFTVISDGGRACDDDPAACQLVSRRMGNGEIIEAVLGPGKLWGNRFEQAPSAPLFVGKDGAMYQVLVDNLP